MEKGHLGPFFFFAVYLLENEYSMIYLKKFDNHAQYEAYASSALIRPNVSHCVAEDDMHYSPYVPDYSSKYLTFIALESGTFSFSGNAINYSLDNGETWTALASEANTPTVAAGNKILWKATGLTPTSNGIGKFSATGNFDAEGNIMSLYYGDNFVGQTDLTGKNFAFAHLFSLNNKIIHANNLVLPATTLAGACYGHMFQRCTSLTAVPALPANTLPASCYSSMFEDCTSLTTAPELPATTLGEQCYFCMFYGCTSLTTAPELPATALVDNCYSYMFQGCTSLTTAPELPATALAYECYSYMFYECTNLNSITCLATDISETGCTDDWVSGVASTGTFTADCHTAWATGANGIPEGWTTITVGDCKD